MKQSLVVWICGPSAPRPDQIDGYERGVGCGDFLAIPYRLGHGRYFLLRAREQAYAAPNIAESRATNPVYVDPTLPSEPKGQSRISDDQI